MSDRFRAFIEFSGLTSVYYEQMRALGKACIWVPIGFPLALVLSACNRPAPLDHQTLRIMLDRAPTTLNPRLSADLNGQRFGELLFASLTVKDSEMKAQPGLAQSWEVQDHGLKWIFHLKPGLKDHDGQEINAERMRSCIEEYRAGKPRSIQTGASPSLKTIEVAPARPGMDAGSLIFHLDRPDPYLANNLTLWRYFTTGDPSKPCREPKPGDRIVGSGDYRIENFRFADLTPETSLKLIPNEPSHAAAPVARPSLFFTWTFDDNAKALAMIRGDIDVLPSSLSLSKSRWLQQKYGDRFKIIERPLGVNVAYLAFNFRNVYLKRPEVRRAIALSIERENFVRYKLLGFATVAGTLLTPSLPDSAPQEFSYDPVLAEKMLDQAGLTRDAQGVRFELRFKTTPIRDGYETALYLQQELHRVGIEVSLEVVEPAVFFASIKKGAFDLYASRWIGASDASIFQRVLKSGNPDNRGAYSSPEMDALLEAAQGENDDSKRAAIYSKVQAKVAEDLPYMPLWYWGPDVILRKELAGLEAKDLSLSGSLEPLARLR